MDELYHTDQNPQPKRPYKLPYRKKMMPVAQPGYKYCCDCEKELPLDQFPKKGNKPSSYCIECTRERNRKRTVSYRRETRRYSPHRSLNVIYPREGYKTCPCCDKELLFECFYPRKGRNGKPMGACIECTRAKDRERNQLRRITKKPRKHQEVIEIPSRVIPTQQCSVCGEAKPLPMFRLKRTMQEEGHEERVTECRECTEKRIEASIVQQSLFFRTCSSCGIEKWLETDFYSKEGKHNTKCKECECEQSSQWHKDHPEQVRKRILKRQSDPEYIEYHRRKEIERYHTIPEVKMQMRVTNKRYKEAKRGTITERFNYKQILERDGYYCYICEQDIDPSVKSGPSQLVFDHIIPLRPRSNEPKGTHTVENIHPAHRICNSRKSNKPFHLLTPVDRQGP